jgi:hypothetical protein
MGPVSHLLCLNARSLPPIYNSHFGLWVVCKVDNIIRMVTDSTHLGREPLCQRRVLLGHSFPYRLPIQTAKGQLHHSNLSSKHQLERQYMLRYFARSMESSLDNLQR